MTRWSIQSGAGGAVERLALGPAVWEVALFEPGVPVCVEREGELRVLHEGGHFAGWPLPVPRIDPGLRAAWLAQAVGGKLYRRAAAFEAAVDRSRRCARDLRQSAQAWAWFDHAPRAGKRPATQAIGEADAGAPERPASQAIGRADAGAPA